MPTTSNFGWTTPADTDLVKDGALAIRTLGNGIDTSFVDLKGGTTGQVLSKTSNTDLDFTWVTSDDANAIQNAIVDAKGDLITATAADTPARLAVGTDGQYLSADSSTATGLKWVTPAAGGGKVLQVVSAVYSTSTAITTTSYSDTGLSLSITPSATSSKILVLVSQNCYTQANQSDAGGGLRLMRGSTAIFADANTYTLYTLLSGNSATKGVGTYLSFNYLDSPSTTSSVTYKTQGRVNSGNNSERFVANNDGWSSTITLLEIGA